MRAGLVGVGKASLFDTNGANKFLMCVQNINRGCRE